MVEVVGERVLLTRRCITIVNGASFIEERVRAKRKVWIAYKFLALND